MSFGVGDWLRPGNEYWDSRCWSRVRKWAMSGCPVCSDVANCCNHRALPKPFLSYLGLQRLSKGQLQFLICMMQVERHAKRISCHSKCLLWFTTFLCAMSSERRRVCRLCCSLCALHTGNIALVVILEDLLIKAAPSSGQASGKRVTQDRVRRGWIDRGHCFELESLANRLRIACESLEAKEESIQ